MRAQVGLGVVVYLADSPFVEPADHVEATLLGVSSCVTHRVSYLQSFRICGGTVCDGMFAYHDHCVTFVCEVFLY